MQRHTISAKVWFRLRLIGWKVVCVLVVVSMLLPGFANVALAAASDPVVIGGELKYLVRPEATLEKGTDIQQGEIELPPTATPTPTPEPSETITTTLTLTPTTALTPTLPAATPTITSTTAITPTLVVTETPTPTPTFFPTLPLTPTETISPTLTPTLTPTPTITLTPTATLTLTLETTPVSTETITVSETLRLILSSDLTYVTPGDEITINWEIEGWDTLAETEGLELLFWMPKSLAPSQDQDGVYDTENSTLRVAIEKPAGQTQWVIAAEAIGPVYLWADLLIKDEALTSTGIELPEQTEFLISKSGGEATGLSGRVKVIFPDKALAEDITLYIGELQSAEKLPRSKSGSPFELTATGEQTKADLRQFSGEITIEVRYDETELWGNENGLKLFYYDPESKGWRVLRSQVDTENNILRAWTNHFSYFDLDIQTWETARLPNLDAAQMSKFTGAATYQFPLWVPPGPAGLEPQLTLSYNSQSVDRAVLYNQASWVGMGWTLETGFIRRNMRGYPNTSSMHTYSLVIGGISHVLLPIADVDGDGDTLTEDYRTSDESFWRVRYYTKNVNNPESKKDTWVVWDKTGTQYIFEERAKYPYFHLSNCNEPFMMTWNWSMTKVVNKFGKALEYTYDTYGAEKDICNDIYDVDLAVWPTTISYPNGEYTIEFVTSLGRKDFDNDWAGLSGGIVFFHREQLDAVKIWQGDPNDELIREYKFTYAPDEGEHIFPYYDWPNWGVNEAKTLTLGQIQEKDGDGNELPEVALTYGDDMHLTHVDNGYGGNVHFEYEYWADVNPTLGETLENPGYLSLWHSEGDVNYGNGGEYFKLLGPFSQVVDHTLPEYLIAFGGAYEVWSEMKRNYLSFPANGFVGMSDNGYTPPTPLPLGFIWVKGAFLLPSADTYMDPYASIKCSNYCEITTTVIKSYPTYYRVTSKTITDTLGSAATFTYAYDEGATNDVIHSEAVSGYPLYGTKWGEFRGHAMVKEESPDGRITTTFFHQDDAKRGQAHTTFVGTETLSETEAFTSTNWSTGTGVTTTLERFRGDIAAHIDNPNTSWSGIHRSAATLTDGETATVQFLVESDTTEVYLGLMDSSSNSWGIKVDGTAFKTYQDMGQGYSEATISGLSVDTDTWYVLQLTVDDNDGFLISLWERDEPSNNASETVTAATGRSWTFFTHAYESEIWLDEYSEGEIYAISRTDFAVDSQPRELLVWEDANNLEFADLESFWVRPSTTTAMTFDGDTNWVGTQTQYDYDDYGNTTDILQAEWGGSSWDEYRLTQTEYITYTSSITYLVGLPGRTQVFGCDNHDCSSPSISEKISESWVLYDDHTLYDTSPSEGVLSGQRTFVCFSGNDCEDTTASQSSYQFSDVKYGYDSWGNQNTVTSYDDYNNWSSFANGTGKTITTTFDTTYHTYPLQVTNPLGHTTTTEYDYTLGVPTVVTDTNDSVTTATYDGFGRMETVCYPGENCAITPNIQLLYHDDAAVFYTEAAQKIDASTIITVAKFYNGLGQLLQTQQLGVEVEGAVTNVLVDYEYDDMGRPVRQSTPYMVASLSGYYTGAIPSGTYYTETAYDFLGRTTVVTTTDLTTQTFAYDGLVTSTTDGEGNTTTTTNDIRGRTVLVEAALGPDVSYQYNDADLLTTVVKGGTITTTLTYDYAGRKLTMDDPDMGEWAYVYDALGNLISQIDGRSCLTSLSYDDLGRVTSKSYSGPGACSDTPSVSYTYDQGTNGIGQRTGMGDGAGTTSWNYDLRGRLITETRVITDVGTFSTQWGGFNSADQPSWMIYPGGANGESGEQVDYDYNSSGALEGIDGDAVYAQGMEYDVAGRLTEIVRGASITTEYGYYPWNQQGGRLHTLATGTTQVLTYTYDTVGNILAITDMLSGTLQTQSFTYDDLNRLSTAQAIGGIGGAYSQETYSYDSQGRLASMPSLGTYGYEDPDHAHAVTHIGDTQKYWYDDNGNMTTRSVDNDSFYLTYDAENRLVQANNTLPLDPEPWFDSNWDYRIPITVTHSGSTLINYDVLVEVDTAALITAGKMKSDCADLRVTDANKTTLLDHWIESGCNTSSTQIWAQAPSIPDGGKIIYIYYGNPSATSGEETWSGNFVMMASGSCPSGWTRVSGLDDRFPRGAASFGGTGGSSNHSHAQASCTTGGTTGWLAIGNGENQVKIDYDHTHDDAMVDVNTASNVLPPYLEMVYCQSAYLEIDSGLIAMYDQATPGGWTRFSALDSKFPQGAESYGSTGGMITHTHSTAGGYITSYLSGAERESGTNNSTAAHTHTTQNGTTEPASSLPPYLEMVFASKDSGGTGEEGSVLIVSALPPLGWSRFTALDDTFPRGASSYGGEGGSSSHSHSVTITTGGPSATHGSGGTGQSTSNANHTHSCTTSTDAGATIPPYLNVIFAQRNDPVAGSAVGSEQASSDYDEPTPSESWYDTDWDYRAPVTASYSGSTLSNYDVLIEVNTAALVTAGKMESDCADLRVTDADKVTLLDHWVEAGCNTSSTQIWVQVPSIPDGGMSLYMYYGNANASSTEEAWSGNFVMMASGSCPTGWTRVSALDDRFPRGASSYGGTGGGSSHSHAQASCTTGGGSGSTSIGNGSGQVFISPDHTHTGAQVDVDTASNVLPPYLEMVYCQRTDLEIDSGLVALFDDSTPTGWTRFSALDGKFPLGSDTYGDTGGSATHSHDTSGGYTTSTVSGDEYKDSNSSNTAEAHNHTSQDGSTDAAGSLPPYLEMVFASVDSDGTGEEGSILIVNAMPPLGWSRFTDLDEAFPRGASSYGSTGGGSSHTHEVTITTGGPSATGGSGAIGLSTSTASHTHTCTDTTDSGANLPPYLDVIFAQRNNPAVSTSVGTEETQESIEEEEVTYSYTYNGDGAMAIEATGVITTVYIGSYYQYVISDTQVITRSYYYAGAQRVAMRDDGTLYYLLSDHLGSTSITLDASGNKVAEMRYKPWGEVRYESGSQKTDYTFTGQRSRTGGFGLIYYNARWYDPSHNQFGQPDSEIPNLYNPLDYNRYAYVRYNPLKYTDPSGHVPCLDDGFCIDETYTEEAHLKYLARQYGIRFTGDWETVNQWAVIGGVQAVGAAFSTVFGGSSKIAFREVFGLSGNTKMKFQWGDCPDCDGSGGYTYSKHRIAFESLSPISLLRRVNNVIHELGHAFDWLVAGNRGTSLMPRNVLDRYARTNDFPRRTAPYSEDDTNYYGLAGPINQRVWHQSTLNTWGEEFADSFLGWVQGSWETTVNGVYTIQAQQRIGFMDSYMPGWISSSGNR